MCFNTSLFHLDLYRPNPLEAYTELYIIYNGIEANSLFRKINFINQFKEIVLENNGCYDDNDYFDNENDVLRAIEKLKEIFNNSEYSDFLIKSAIIEYIEKEQLDAKKESGLKRLFSYFSMLEKDYVLFIVNQI